MDISISYIEKHWPLTGVRLNILQQGLDNRNVWKIESNEGRFICKLASPWKTAHALGRDLQLFEFLENTDYGYAPSLLRTVDDRLCTPAENQFAYILRYVDGSTPASVPEIWQLLGHALGELHSVKDYPNTTDFDPQVIIEKNYKTQSEKLEFAKEYLALGDALPDFHAFPKTFVHYEANPHNSVLTSEGNIVLLDWDDAGMGIAVLDLGVPFIWKFISRDLNVDEHSARAFYVAYSEHRALRSEERAALFDAGLFWALMYIEYDDPHGNWNRIQFAIKHRSELESSFLP